VGDEAFQRKSSDRIFSFRDQGTTILIVSHNMSVIETMCHRAAWLNQGQIRMIDEASTVVQAYRGSL
jgi:teichoic acid transport system ATP-binding protein